MNAWLHPGRDVQQQKLHYFNKFTRKQSGIEPLKLEIYSLGACCQKVLCKSGSFTTFLNTFELNKPLVFTLMPTVTQWFPWLINTVELADFTLTYLSNCSIFCHEITKILNICSFFAMFIIFYYVSFSFNADLGMTHKVHWVTWVKTVLRL